MMSKKKTWIFDAVEKHKKKKLKRNQKTKRGWNNPITPSPKRAKVHPKTKPVINLRINIIIFNNFIRGILLL